MGEVQDMKHMCKLCNKAFPCGRSLGGHMRSHLINIPSDHNLPRKKLPPGISAKNNGKTDVSIGGGSQSGYGLRENPSKTKKIEENTLLQVKFCKECGKSFPSWKSLFGHMKCHSVNGKTANDHEDSWNSSNDHQKLIMDSQSDNEAGTPFCKKKRSDRMKRYTATTNSSSLNIVNCSPCVSEIDQLEQEEVALSLIMLSRDTGNLVGGNSAVESSDNSSEFVETKKSVQGLDKKPISNDDQFLKFKTLKNGKLESIIMSEKQTDSEVKKSEFRPPVVPRNGLKTSKSAISVNESEKILEIEGNESEVNSPRDFIKKTAICPFVSDGKKNKSSKRKCIDPYESDSKQCQDLDRSKFTCTICKKAFSSYQALGGHRASHKKFKGSCAPRTENSLEAESSLNQSANGKLTKCTSNESLVSFFAPKTDKYHECPICFRVFSSGQALGGHKRSHLIGDQTKSVVNPSTAPQKPIPEIRNFLDLNLPAPVEEECNDFKSWWIGSSSHKHEHEALLGLL